MAENTNAVSNQSGSLTQRAVWGWVIIGIIAIIGGVIWACVSGSSSHVRGSAEAPSSAQAPAAPARIRYTNIVVVTDQWTRQEIPDRYQMDWNAGNAPVDTRSSRDLNGIDHDHMPDHVDGGTRVQWREWRVSPGFKPAQAEVECVFTSL